MKLKFAIVLLAIVSLTGCATVSGQRSSITHQPDQKELDVAFNTARDGVMQSWVGGNDTHYDLTTSNTHVNYQGVPCRDFDLVISKSFYRGNTLTGTACRYNNQWTDIKSNDE